jgi:hypothetical protein
MYNENKANQLKDVLSPMVVGIAAAIHLGIIILFCLAGSSSEKEIEEVSKPSMEQSTATNNVNEIAAPKEEVKKSITEQDKNPVVEQKKVSPPSTPDVPKKPKVEKPKVVKENPTKAAPQKVAPKKVLRVNNPAAKKKHKTSSDIKKGQFKKGPLKKR